MNVLEKEERINHVGINHMSRDRRNNTTRKAQHTEIAHTKDVMPTSWLAWGAEASSSYSLLITIQHAPGAQVDRIRV